MSELCREPSLFVQRQKCYLQRWRKKRKEESRLFCALDSVRAGIVGLTDGVNDGHVIDVQGYRRS